jgi:hypothetical protein
VSLEVGAAIHTCIHIGIHLLMRTYSQLQYQEMEVSLELGESCLESTIGGPNWADTQTGMCEYVLIYIYIYIYMYIYVCIYVYMYICMYVYACMYICMYTCQQMFVHVQRHTHTHTHTRTLILEHSAHTLHVISVPKCNRHRHTSTYVHTDRQRDGQTDRRTDKCTLPQYQKCNRHRHTFTYVHTDAQKHTCMLA